MHTFAGHTDGARTNLREILHDVEAASDFTTPKPCQLIQRVLQVSTDENSIVLDSFAGSGTTGHAVLKQNSEDGGNRKFIMVEIDSIIARDVTAERMSRVINGYTSTKSKEVAGLGSGFQFCKLSDEPLFDANGQIRSDVTFAQLAEFVWFAETGSGFSGNADSPLLGAFEEKAIYLLYNGILEDRSIDGGNILTTPVFNVLPEFDGPKVIYATACRIGNTRLNKLGIQFKQTPYALEI